MFLLTLLAMPEFLIGLLFLFAAMSPFNVVLLLVIVLVVGVFLGYLFRSSIGRDLSQFQISSIVKHLDAYADTAAASVRSEVSKLSTDLRKLF